MIIDLQKFIGAERPYWDELEQFLEASSRDPLRKLSIEEILRFHHLYERVSADLGRLATFSSERETRVYLESLVARAYAEIHESGRHVRRLRPFHWFFTTFPVAARRHARAMRLSLAVTLVGALFGGVMTSIDPEAKEILMPFPHLLKDPSERVAEEEKEQSSGHQPYSGVKARGAAWYIRHNTQVSFFTLSTGMTWGVGTLLLLFTNGVLLGAVAIDYVLAGETRFLVGWLLPHGSVEIPALLLAGQAAFVLAGALVGWGRRISMRERLRQVVPDVATLAMGMSLFLVWAGIIEAFLSQYHEPIIPYSIKILFGAIQLMLVLAFFKWSGRGVMRRRPLRATGREQPEPAKEVR